MCQCDNVLVVCGTSSLFSDSRDRNRPSYFLMTLVGNVFIAMMKLRLIPRLQCGSYQVVLVVLPQPPHWTHLSGLKSIGGLPEN